MRHRTHLLLPCRSPSPCPGGFTVPEVLAVVAIITIILSILLPSFTGSRWEANKAKCGGQMRQISIAARAYSVDHNGYVVQVRSKSVQIAIDPAEQLLFARYGYPKEHWRCPGRNYEPQLESSLGNQLVIGYQYFGGIERWINNVGTFDSKSPIKMAVAGPRWVVAADTTMKVDGKWGGGRPEAFGDMPSHRKSNPWPEGGYHTYVDGSAQWVPFDDMYMIHSWAPSSRMGFFRQDDMPEGLNLTSLVSAKAHKP